MSGIPFRTMAGSPYEVGHRLGTIGRPIVLGYLVRTPAWQSVMGRRSDGRVAAMADLVESRFPAAMAELHGLADGLDLPFDKVFAWNCRGDLWAMAPDGCTTVQLPGPDRQIIAHNEDGLPGLAGACFMASIAVAGARRFACFVYPGSLPGHSFALTEAGLAQAVNNVRPTRVAVGVPRMVLSRAMLEAPTIDAAVAVLSAVPRAGGFHITLGQAVPSRMVSVEFCEAAVSVTEVMHPAVHANHFLHPALADVPEIVTASSAARQRRAQALLDARCAPLAILRDAADPVLPIHRLAPDDPDAENTLATARFTIGPNDMRCEVFEGPSSTSRLVIGDGLVPLRSAAPRR